MGNAKAFLERWRRSWRRSWFWFLVVSSLWVAAGALILEKMEHPWEGMTGRRLELGRPWLAEDYGRYWGFWLGTIATGIVALVTITSRWWWSWAHPAESPETVPPRNRFHWMAWVILVAILLLAAWMRMPRLTGPFLRDEQDTIRHHVHGYHFHDRKNGAALTFEQVTWAESAFWNPGGNNPVLMSLLSKASLQIWRGLSGASEERFSHVAVRLPPFIAGLASIAALAWFVLGFAPQRVALLAALLAAIHPLHIQYCVEARGYAFVMLGAAVALGAAIRAVQQGRWRHWIGLVFGSALMLYAYLGSGFFVAPLALTAIFLVLWRWRGAVLSGEKGAARLARRDVVRLGVTGIVGLSLYLVVAMPPAMCFWDNRELFPASFAPSGQWWVVFWTEYASGHFFQISHSADGALPPLSQLIENYFKSQPLLWFEMFLAPILVVAGLVGVWRRSERGTAFLIGVSFFTPFFQIAVHWSLTHMVLFFFYLIYWLPVVIGLEAWAADAAILWATKRRFPGRNNEENPIVWRLKWATFALAFFLLILASISPGRIPKTWNPEKRPAAPVVYDRGEAHWIVYPEGRILKLGRELPVPNSFPESSPRHSA